MKNILVIIGLSLCCILNIQAQTAEEIVNNYLKAIGGIERLSELESIRMKSTVKAQGMEMPAELVKKLPNKLKMTLSFQGYEIVQPAFDGEKGWTTNIMTMQNEEMDVDGSAAMKQEAQDFPDTFYQYKEKGYIVSREEDVEENGKKYYVLTLSKSPVIIGGEEITNDSKFFFDQNTFLPYKRTANSEAGPTKGMESNTVYTEYKEVEGIKFPFKTEQMINNVLQATIEIETIEINIPIDDFLFTFPE